ncbi:MAG: SIMPL domain-containing protein [Candidatus Pacebacteria bacterium]|nr:SIMPL domain-containing protein [Candidatus Paceibacterota bacterium]
MVKDFKDWGGCCKTIGVIVAVLLIILAGYYLVSIQEKIKQIEYIGGGMNTNVITVSKKGTVYATPDLAQISFSVITEEEEVGDAIKNNSEKSSAVIEILKAQGVSETDIKTTYFNVYPLYEWHKTDSADIYSTGTRVLVGYEATETIAVKVRDVEKIGSIIEGAVGAGANEVSDLRFVVENEEAFKAQARAKAIAEARAEAVQTAQSLGVKLGKIVSFTESSYTPYYESYKSATAVGMGGGSADSSITSGENKIEVTVNIVFEIR